MTSLHRIRRHPGIVAIAALTWLPYVSTRCIDTLTCECSPAASLRMVHDRYHTDGDREHVDRHLPHEDCARGAARSHAGREPASRHACCESKGKCAADLILGGPSGSPPTAVHTIAVVVAHPKVDVVTLAKRVADPTHHPPPYIRFATLLI